MRIKVMIDRERGQEDSLQVEWDNLQIVLDTTIMERNAYQTKRDAMQDSLQELGGGAMVEEMEGLQEERDSLQA